MTLARWKSLLRYAVSATILLAAWEIVIVVFDVPAYVLPVPTQVLGTLLNEHDWYLGHTTVTLINMTTGGFIGISIGIVLGLLVAYSRVLLWIIEPYLVIFQSFPREALIPVIVVWLGFGHAPKIMNAALLSFFPMALITLNSLLDTRVEYLELVRNWGATKWQEFIHCRLPYAIQPIVGGLKITIPLALIGAVLGEFMGGSEGLGHVIVSSGANFRMDRSFAALVVLSLIGVLSLASVHWLQDVVLKRFKQE